MTDAPDQTETYFITDAALIERLGLPVKVARAALRVLDANPRSGFPPKHKLWGDRRWWPAVEAYFKARYGNVQDGAARSAAESRERHPVAAPFTPAEPKRREANHDH